MNESADRPGVVALPPLIFFAALLVGTALHWFVPLALPVPFVGRMIAGAVGIAAVALMTTARFTFTNAGTNVNPMQPALALVASGPFRYTRNPMYVGMSVAFTCLALVIRNGWLLVLMAPVLALLHWGIVLREERYLGARFGEAYAEYRRRVRRYF